MITKEDVGFCRGLRVRDGNWAFGGYSYHTQSGRGFITNVGIDNKGPICWMQEVDPKTVGRFTGLYDATPWDDLPPEQKERIKKEEWQGYPIFEGDILEAHYDKRFPEVATHTVVVYGEPTPHNPTIGFGMKQGAYDCDPIDKVDASVNRVVGNIHQTKINEELLNGKML